MSVFDLTAGHISISHGEISIDQVDWASLICEPSQTFAETLKKHTLFMIEAPELRLKVEFYVMQASLRLHTDLTPDLGMTTRGLILEAENDLVITTGKNSLPAKAGDVYALDPNKLHGTQTSGFLAFATYDYPSHRVPDPQEFRRLAIVELTRLLDARKIRYARI